MNGKIDNICFIIKSKNPTRLLLPLHLITAIVRQYKDILLLLIVLMAEFQPGVPWKGIQSSDSQSDPYMAPGSVLGSTGTSSLNDSDHQLLRDNIGMRVFININIFTSNFYNKICRDFF